MELFDNLLNILPIEFFLNRGQPEAAVAAPTSNVGESELKREQDEPPDLPHGELLNHEQAAALPEVNVSGGTIRRWLDEGLLTPHGMGRKVDKTELLAKLPQLRKRRKRHV